MSVKPTRQRARIVRYESLGDEEAERRAAADPDADAIPPGFWDQATVRLPRNKQQITLRLDPEIIGWFKRTGKGYQSRMGAVLRSYVEAKRKRG
jgi:uncharacterized protein (DUF4415 family)